MDAERERNAVVEAHLPIADRAARRTGARGPDRADLRQAALLAILRAAASYDPSRGPFAPLAWRAAKRAVARESAALRSPVSISERVRCELLSDRRAFDALVGDVLLDVDSVPGTNEDPADVILARVDRERGHLELRPPAPLHGLTRAQREAVAARLASPNKAAAAAALGVTTRSFRRRLNRALARLRGAA